MCNLSLSLSLYSLPPHPLSSLSCGSSKQPWWGQLRGWCLTSQAENGPCPFLPCSIFPSCLSFVMDTACNKKSQHIYGVSDLTATQVFYLPATEQLCYSLTIHKPTPCWWCRCGASFSKAGSLCFMYPTEDKCTHIYNIYIYCMDMCVEITARF